jgi:anti-anti-sigma regulatory factor
MQQIKAPKKRKAAKRAHAPAIEATSCAAPVIPDAAPEVQLTAEPPPAVIAAAEVMPRVELGHSLEIKDVEAAHRQLLEALERGPSVTVDMSRLGATDTAGVQLLLAFKNEAGKRGVAVDFLGEPPALAQALAVLGLRDAFPMVRSP